MEYEQLQPGTYEASLLDWTIEKGDYGPYALFKFEVQHLGKTYSAIYASGFENKNGKLNGNLLLALKAMEFNSKNLADIVLPDNGINNRKKYSVQVERQDNGKTKIKWINDLSAGPKSKIDKVKSLEGLDLSHLTKEMEEHGFGKQLPKKIIKNYAPNASDDNSEIPF